MRRQLLVRMIVSGAVLALVACSAAAASTAATTKAKDTTITFIAAQYTDNTQSFWQSIINKFEAQYPGAQVDLQVVSWSDITQKVATLVANHQEPDILNLNTFASFANDGLLYPASQYVSPQVVQDVIPALLANSKFKGVTYALPLGASDRPLFYNKDIFKKAHIAAPPKTWAQLEADALKIKHAGFIGYGLPLGAEEAQAEFSSWMWNNGGDWMTGGKWTINSAKNLQTLTFLNRLANIDKVTESNPGYTDRTSGVWRLFADGKVGMALGASITLPQMLQQNPSVHWGVAAPPTPSSKPASVVGVNDYLMAFKNGDSQKLAVVKEFLDFIYAPKIYSTFFTNIGGLPATKSASAVFAHNPAFTPYMRFLPKARFYPSTDPAWPTVQSDVQHQIGLALQGKSPKSILDRLQQEAVQAQKSQG